MGHPTSWHLMALVAVCVTIIATTTLALLNSDRDVSSTLLLLVVAVSIPPLIAIVAATLIADRQPRIVALWLSAALMTWPAALGAFGGWGLLYVMGIIFTLYAAWQENEAG